MTQKVLVTGGTGNLGKLLVQKLRAGGKKVVTLSRGRKNHNQAIHNQIVHYRGDVSKPLLDLSENQYRELCTDLTAIYHLAARTDFKGPSDEDYRPVNVTGVENIHALACEADAHLHHVSTAFVCGTHKTLFGENDLHLGQHFHNPYEKSKFLGEQFLRRQITEGNRAITIYRPSIILERHPSPESANSFGPFTFLDAVYRLLLLDPVHETTTPLRIPGSRECHLPMIFDDHVVEAILTLGDSNRSAGRTFHLVSKTPCPNKLLEDTFNLAFNREAARFVEKKTLDQSPLSRAERILARKTSAYSPYLDLTTRFSRHNTNEIMGKDFCPAIDTEELLSAFSHFLSCKKKTYDRKQVKRDRQKKVEKYFTEFLPTILGRQLISNLTSLTCSFWIQVTGLPRRTLVITKGLLQDVYESDEEKDFGYTVQHDIFLRVVSGQLSPQQAFFEGKITLSGNTMEALRTAAALEEFFRFYPYSEKFLNL